MTSIVFFDCVNTLGTNIFKWCDKLIEINVIMVREDLEVADGVLFHNIRTHLIWCSPEKSGSDKIPPTLKTIDEHAFRLRKKLTSITIPNPIT